MYVAAGAATEPTTGEAIVEAGKFILQDPALPSIAKTVVKIYKLTPPSKSVGQAVGTSKSALSTAAPTLNLYAYTLEHPWSKWLGIAVLLGIPLAFGYVLGRRM